MFYALIGLCGLACFGAGIFFAWRAVFNAVLPPPW